MFCSPSHCVLGASTGQAGESQEEVMESSPSFSPLSGSVTPSSESVSEVGVDSGDDGVRYPYGVRTCTR